VVGELRSRSCGRASPRLSMGWRASRTKLLHREHERACSDAQEGPIRKESSAEPGHSSAVFSRTFLISPKPPPWAAWSTVQGCDGNGVDCFSHSANGHKNQSWIDSLFYYLRASVAIYDLRSVTIQLNEDEENSLDNSMTGRGSRHMPSSSRIVNQS
jgi:hypothetical protein